MTVLVHKAVTDTNQFTLPEVELGQYSIRVRAVDIDGLQGLNSSRRFTISPVPGTPKAQKTKAVYKTGEPLSFSWQEAAEATKYRWRLAKDRQFKDIVAETDLTTTVHNQAEGVPAGTYYWVVAAGNHNGFGRFVNPIEFKVELPAVPVLAPIAGEMTSEESLELGWNEVELATEYHWQISTDESFDSILREGKTSSTQAVIDGLPEQELYIRVAAVGPYNLDRFSETKSIEVVEPSNGKTAFSIGSVLLFILLL
jgi:predicted phage tail protein